jgi:hypothetical protein
VFLRGGKKSEPECLTEHVPGHVYLGENKFKERSSSPHTLETREFIGIIL